MSVHIPIGTNVTQIQPVSMLLDFIPVSAMRGLLVMALTALVSVYNYEPLRISMCNIII